MKMDEELLKIAEKDLQASKVLYENELYAQAIFYFQQSVEKANKTYALITNQVTEAELPKKVGHEAIKIYKKSIEQQKNRYQKINENLNKLPEIKDTNIFKNAHIQIESEQFDFFLSYIERIEKNKNESIFMTVWDIQRFLNEIKSFKKDIKKDMRSISSLKITESDWKIAEKNFNEIFNIALKYSPSYAEEMKEDFEQFDVKQLENILKNYFRLMSINMSISVSLYHLAIITLSHSIITRYPLNGLNPTEIYNEKLPIVSKLPELIDVLDNVLYELKKLKEIEVTNLRGDNMEKYEKLNNFLKENIGVEFKSPRNVFQGPRLPQNFKILKVDDEKKQIKIQFESGTPLTLEYWRFEEAICFINKNEFVPIGARVSEKYSINSLEGILKETAKKKSVNKKTDTKTAPHIADLLTLANLTELGYAKSSSNRKVQGIRLKTDL